ncbi:redoxin domain-containing protein [Flammeovirga aprica]|uniref:AhpC/TSA family protein n=1 Tax=Flammeovirga aprica JL-4 TaxID=694437 RepID=A0A7X9NZE9_9BACT|nr:TlpA disulfide reductase family protein [Flammeovirga aprica]NME66485.1 AhpC/TSA family protein [Flammeovirga aprica JL-4]
MKTLHNIFFLLLAFIVVSCGGSTENNGTYPAKVKISGTLDGQKEGTQIILYTIQGVGGKKNVAEATTNAKGAFTLEYTVPKIGLYTLNIGNQAEELLVLETKDLKVENNGEFFKVTGSKENDQLNELKDMYDSFTEKGNELQQEYATSENQAAVLEKFKKLQDEQKGAVKAMLKKLDGAYVTLVALNFIQDKEGSFDVISETIQKLETNFPQDSLVMEVAKSYNALKSTMVGAEAMPITLPSPQGETIALESFRGKYVMIDFWASWCRPCRMENPNVLKAYTKYKDKGFEVYGVSIDRDAEAWKGAIAQDHISWTQVLDADGEVAKQYGVEGIPFTLLLDQEGKIIAKNLRGDALEKKLEELLGK